ncbi:hypothetical protein [Escherichia coli]|uniref:hypothetical protein n=1 Tax=Escherichia coli TaxID=562 RepID=UPI00180A433A|nr:hypothetical protein [Escherichia coli]EFM6520588.1 hypothetical protein [Escherichia coli]EIV9095605.1 hypothetical protein [Escherichia coli]HCL9682002.1 hypothetical protein [Escherichia coli]
MYQLQVTAFDNNRKSRNVLGSNNWITTITKLKNEMTQCGFKRFWSEYLDICDDVTIPAYRKERMLEHLVKSAVLQSSTGGRF